MSKHFTTEQISAWVSGAMSPDMEAHARECDACRMEVERFSAGLKEFRGAVRVWSEQQGGLASRRLSVRSARFPLVRWGAAAAVLALAAAAPFYYQARERSLRAEEAARQARADAALLQQVDYDISRAVPTPLEPLEALISRSPNSSQKGTTE